MIVTYDFGTFTFRMMVVADIASGGEIIPPKRKPNAKVKPGMKALETNATTHEVMITIGKAKLIITRLHFQNSFHDVCHAASYRSGGKKIKKTRSGLMVTFEKTAVKLSSNPPNTSTIGYAVLILLASMTSAKIIRIRKMYCMKMVCIRRIIL